MEEGASDHEVASRRATSSSDADKHSPSTAARDAARFVLLGGGPLVGEQALAEDFGGHAAPDDAGESRRAKTSGFVPSTLVPPLEQPAVTSAQQRHSRRRQSSVEDMVSTMSGTEALLGTGEILGKWLFNCGKIIVIRDTQQATASTAAVDALHYEFVAVATSSLSVDRVVQSMRYATSRRVILRALLRSAALVIDDQLSQTSRLAGSGDGAGEHVDHALRFFPDDDDRMLDEALLHACVIAFVNIDALEVDGLLEEGTVEDLSGLVRWVVQISKKKSYASLPSLAVAMSCLIYSNGLGPVNWRTAQDLRRLVDSYRMTYSGYDDAVSTVNELHLSFLGGCYQLCRHAINDLLPRIQRNLASVSASAKTATLLHRAMVEVRSVLEWYIESVEETFHALIRREERSRQFLEGSWRSDLNAIEDMFHAHGEIAHFEAAWANFFALIASEEEAFRKELEEDMLYDADLLECQILDFIRCPHHVIHRDIWEEVLWDLRGIDEQEKSMRADRAKQEHFERNALKTASEIDRQSIGTKNIFEEYYLEDAERRSVTRQQTQESLALQRPQEDHQRPAIIVPIRPVSPPMTSGSFRGGRSRGGPGIGTSISLELYDEARAIGDEETVERELLASEESTLRTNFMGFVRDAFLHVSYDWSLAGSSAMGFSQLPLVRSRDFMSAASGVGKQPDRHLPAYLRTQSVARISPPRASVSPSRMRTAAGASATWSSTSRAESRGVGLLSPRPPTSTNFQATVPPASQTGRSSILKVQLDRSPSNMFHGDRSAQPSVTLGRIASVQAQAATAASSPQPVLGQALHTRALSALEDEYFGPRSRRTAKYGKGGSLLPSLPSRTDD